MNKIYRLTGMILLFLLLANGGLTSASKRTTPARTAGITAPESTSSPGSGTWNVHPSGRGRTELGVEHGMPVESGGKPVLEPDLRRVLAGAEADERIRVIVHVDPPPGVAASALYRPEGVESRAELVSSLQAVAEQSQSSMRSYLESRRVSGGVHSYEPLWITNAIAVEAQASIVRDIAVQRSVASVRLDRWRRWIHNSIVPVGLETMRAEEVEWNVDRIRAEEVWASLQISGAGAVVAGMDTGADWLHPALQANYRGYNPHGPAVHAYNWYDATDGGALYPVDGHGHGSHTLGTAVGQHGIGVAPGATWIGVRVLNSQGYGYDSWIHAGFQWLLAPGGDPSRAPDVVNCSWGSKNAAQITFRDDLRALRAAGILPVFSNGNDGPGEGTVSSPASLPEAFGVGAVDQFDEVATFSSRGPSPWGEIRPHVVAPGVHIRSSMPGGAYATMNGTSMAAPHASGVAALLRSVSPTVTITRTAYVITSTALQLGEGVPNNDVGWGRVDALAAVTTLASPGIIRGNVRDSETRLPIQGAGVVALSHGGEASGDTTTDEEGHFSLALSPGMYDVRISAFGYEPETVQGVRVVTDTATSRTVGLVAQPTGKLDVRVLDATRRNPLTATVAVAGTPYEVTADTHAFELPSGTYSVEARRLGYRVVTSTVVISADQTSSVTLLLPETPALLLVDSGGWYYQSQIAYFRQALDDLSYAYDEWSIRRLPETIPSAEDVMPYDILIWSAPRDAPGYIGAGDVITRYLESGGRLMLSGQDVGFWDGGGSGSSWSSYYRDYLKARFVDDIAPTRVLDGVDGDILAGSTITIAGPGGADNQDYPDVVSVVDADAAAPVLTYREGGCGGLRVGTCVDYRAVYLPFGFEAINDRVSRRGVMKDVIDWLSGPAPTVGLELEPASQLRIGSPGSLVTHTVRVRHVGQGGSDDKVDLTVNESLWPTELSDSSLTLSPCASATVTVSVTIPLTAAWDMRNPVTLTAQSSLSPTHSVSVVLDSKVPAPILLVDDDRWYDQQVTYEAAMSAAELPYDLWENSPPELGGHQIGPSFETLNQYPIVVWWTGYDWHAPVTTAEVGILERYLNSGGRLFLSSQDFLYYHGDSSFRQTHLGVLTYTQDVTPTEVTAVADNPMLEASDTWSLSFPAGYRNWSDGVVPAPDVGVAFRDQERYGNALTRRIGGSATTFLSFPFEALPVDARSAVMRAGVGWLSWLGPTTFEADPKAVTAGDTISYTLTVLNDGPESVTASVSNTLPVELALEGGSVVGPGRYDPIERRLSWRGVVEPARPVTVTYRAQVVTGTPAAQIIVNPVRISLEDHGVTFDRDADAVVDRPDLSASSFACTPAVVPPGRTITCGLTLINTGTADAPAAVARVRTPGRWTPVASSVWIQGVETEWMLEEDGIAWTGPLPAKSESRLTFQLAAPNTPIRRTLYGVAFLEDGTGGRWERPTWLEVRPWEAHLPILLKRNR